MDPDGLLVEDPRRVVVRRDAVAGVASSSFGCRIVERNIHDYNAQSYANQSNLAECLNANDDGDAGEEDEDEDAIGDEDTEADGVRDGKNVVNCGRSSSGNQGTEGENCYSNEREHHHDGTRSRCGNKAASYRVVSSFQDSCGGDCFDHDDDARERQKQHRQTFKLSKCEQARDQFDSREEDERQQLQQPTDFSFKLRKNKTLIPNPAGSRSRSNGSYLKSHLASANQLNEKAINDSGGRRSDDLSRIVSNELTETTTTLQLSPTEVCPATTTCLTCSFGCRRSLNSNEQQQHEQEVARGQTPQEEEEENNQQAKANARLLSGKSSILLVDCGSWNDVNYDRSDATRVSCDNHHHRTSEQVRRTGRLARGEQVINAADDDDERAGALDHDYDEHPRQAAASLERAASKSSSSFSANFKLENQSACTIDKSCTSKILAPKSSHHEPSDLTTAKLDANSSTTEAPLENNTIEQQIGSEDLFYLRLLSNLTKSITQRHQKEPLHNNSNSNSNKTAGSSVVAGNTEAVQLSHCAINQELAPEVIGYLNNRLKRQQPRPTTARLFATAHKSTTIEGCDQADHRASKMTASSNVDACKQPTAGAASKQQQQLPLRLNDDNQDPTNNQKFVKLVALPASEQVQQQQQLEQNQISQSSESKQQQQQQPTKLSIATTTTTTATTTTTTTRSSVSSLSSCILSDVTSESEVRLKWSKKMDFLLSIIGFAVDLANIWRFPYLVYKNGGGVFLIPYTIMLVFGGIPLFFLELCLGQFVKKGPITVWNKICPSMKGVGYCSILISWYVSFYYNVLIAWSVYFIYRSLLSIGDKMPWEDCDNPWNSKGTCVSISQLKLLCSTRNETTSLESCRKQLFDTVNVTSPASEFFVKELSQIDQSTGLDDMGLLRPELVACTIIVYLLHYFSLFRGLETSGKVVWVTATAPYIILSILLVRGLFLPGASMGIEYYLSPKLEKLADPQVWIDAAGQVFYSIGVGFGVHLTYASFNSHNNNCYRDCLMTSAVNAATSVYSGLVVFVYLGYMAKNLGIEIDKVASEGYSLVFEVYPEALTTLPIARFWSILFFIMLLTLGIDSAMGGLEAVITGLEDEFKFAKRLSRGQLTGLVIFSSFLPALISCTQGGAYTLFWFDIYSAGVSLLFSALFETIGVVYCYGLDKFIVNIESMLGRRPHLFFILCWKYISPVFLVGVIFMSIYTASTPVYRGYTFPVWSIVLGWCLAFSSVAAIPIVALWTWLSGAPMLAGGKRSGGSPEKSPRKKGDGPDGGSSRHLKKQTEQQHYKTMTISCNNRECRIGGSASGGNGGGSLTTTTILESSPSEHHRYIGIVNPMRVSMGEEML